MSSSLVTNRDYLINLNSGANTLSILGTVAITGNLSVTGNATLSGNILGDRIQNGTTSIDIQTINGNANITVGGVSNVAVFATTGTYVTGVVSATGNITGNYFVGNGSQLTGIVGTYGNANVVANLALLGSNPVSTTGNITAGKLGAVNLVINNISSDDSTFVTVEDGLNVTSGFISAPESMSLTAGVNTWILGTNGNLTAPGAISAVGNITGGNLTTAGAVKTGVFVTGTIPTAAGVGAGARAFVTDATSVTFGNLYVGGAANAMPVWSNGTSWYVG
jgi:hypothetical protein